MSFASMFAFAIAMGVLAASPGPAFFALVSEVMTKGVIAGAGVLVGVLIGDVVFLVLALMGMSAIANTLGRFFVMVKLIGGGYIIWLGVKMWRREPTEFSAPDSTSKSGFFKSLLQGLAVNLTNPKAVIFFAALLPTIVDVTNVSLTDGFILAGIVIAAGVLIDGSYILLARRAAKFFKSKKAQRRLNRIGGMTLGAVGAAVISR